MVFFVCFFLCFGFNIVMLVLPLPVTVQSKRIWIFCNISHLFALLSLCYSGIEDVLIRSDEQTVNYSGFLVETHTLQRVEDKFFKRRRALPCWLSFYVSNDPF